jgi:hypothetical protein
LGRTGATEGGVADVGGNFDEDDGTSATAIDGVEDAWTEDKFDEDGTSLTTIEGEEVAWADGMEEEAAAGSAGLKLL